jgi:CBS domain-containing protein
MRRLSDLIWNQSPLTLSANSNAREACQEMSDRRVGAVLVTDGDKHLIGIFTGRDVISRIVAAGKNASKTKLSEVMTPNPITMSPEKTVIEALRLMWDGGFRHIPLVQDEKLIGIVSRGDFRGNEQDRLDEERKIWEQMR